MRRLALNRCPRRKQEKVSALCVIGGSAEGTNDRLEAPVIFPLKPSRIGHSTLNDNLVAKVFWGDPQNTL